MECNELFLQALDEVYNERFENYMSSLGNKGDEEHVFSDRHNKKMRRLIKRQQKPYFKLICTAGRRVACIIVAVIVISASALSVEAVRKAVFDFITKIFSNHNVVTVESGTDEGYPDIIEEEYYISALPEGFEEADNIKSDKSIDIVYLYEDDYVFFTQNTKSNYEQYFDNEYSEYSDYIDSDGEKYLIITSDFDSTYIWDNGRYIFIVQSNLDKDEILNLCKSTKIKNNLTKTK